MEIVHCFIVASEIKKKLTSPSIKLNLLHGIVESFVRERGRSGESRSLILEVHSVTTSCLSFTDPGGGV